ncbi:MAG: hypothetical protein HKO63_00030 [Acidimicrobiia bacterium]|nr:hypothetical protein [Acidimicrobiia bacterium]MBT8191937.1 hypothetical protein [Acidimicrobiia bacterium]MBT8246288.1 hypothetical protein [Acidimicrobiia bacterium]NNF87570.1 hypothetical protein [Acidimicrobiia bacterium]NNJ46270.1 hypothetical protein [Acidimicrobiia bacterium]
MGQEPQIEMLLEDPPAAEPGPARRWSATRPGDFRSPAEVPWGEGFGTPGPDTGYALKLASQAQFVLEPDENRHNVESVLVLIMSARASLFGKAPSADDLSFALLLIGLGADASVPEAGISALKANRKYWAPRVSHGSASARRLVSMLSPELLRLSVSDLRHQLALGEVPLTP